MTAVPAMKMMSLQEQSGARLRGFGWYLLVSCRFALDLEAGRKDAISFSAGVPPLAATKG